MRTIIKKYLPAAVISLAGTFWACSNLEGTFEKYQGDGEYSYVGKVDQIRFNEGFDRVQFEGDMKYAKSATQIVVEWNDQQKKANVADVTRDGKCRFFIDGLKEGNVVFKVYTLDGSGKRSIAEQFQVSVAGDRFKADQRTRSLDRFKLNTDDGLELEFGQSNSKVFETVYLEYPDAEGAQQRVAVPANEHGKEIGLFTKGAPMKVVWSIKPSRNAVDSLTVEKTFTMPEYTCEPMNRSKFVDMRLATDAAQLNATYSVPRMWDDNVKTYAHTHSNNGVPNHMTIDMGAEYTLLQGKIVVRNEPWDWSPSEIQVWGLPEVEAGKKVADYEPVMTDGKVMLDNFANKAIWEAAATEKGWINLTQRSFSVNSVIRVPDKVECTFDLYGDRQVRYIRYRTVKTLGKVTAAPTDGATGQYTCTAEIYFWYKKMP